MSSSRPLPAPVRRRASRRPAGCQRESVDPDHAALGRTIACSVLRPRSSRSASGCPTTSPSATASSVSVPASSVPVRSSPDPAATHDRPRPAHVRSSESQIRHQVAARAPQPARDPHRQRRGCQVERPHLRARGAPRDRKADPRRPRQQRVHLGLAHAEPVAPDLARQVQITSQQAAAAPPPRPSRPRPAAAPPARRSATGRQSRPRPARRSPEPLSSPETLPRVRIV